MTYSKLNERLKKELLKKVGEVEIEVQDLPSYYYDRNPYGVEDQLIGSSGCGIWDENEEWQEQISEAKRMIANDGACEYLTLEDEDWDNKDDLDCTTLTNECVYYLESLEE